MNSKNQKRRNTKITKTKKHEKRWACMLACVCVCVFLTSNRSFSLSTFQHTQCPCRAQRWRENIPGPPKKSQQRRRRQQQQQQHQQFQRQHQLNLRSIALLSRPLFFTSRASTSRASVQAYFLRLAFTRITQQCLPGQSQPDVLRPGIAGMRGHTVIRLSLIHI